MLNSYNNNNSYNTLHINAVSGGIYKTYIETWFERFHLKSNIANILFSKNKAFYNPSTNEFSDKDYSGYEKVIVLQIVMCGDMEVIAELILEKDLEKNFSKAIDN